jgi:hypothetical protein
MHYSLMSLHSNVYSVYLLVRHVSSGTHSKLKIKELHKQHQQYCICYKQWVKHAVQLVLDLCLY